MQGTELAREEKAPVQTLHTWSLCMKWVLVFGPFPLVLYKFKKMNSKFCFLPYSTDDKTLLLPGMDLETGTCHLTGALTTMRWNGNGETTSKTVSQDSETPYQPCRFVHHAFKIVSCSRDVKYVLLFTSRLWHGHNVGFVGDGVVSHQARILSNLNSLSSLK